MTAGGWGDFIGYLTSECPKAPGRSHVHPVWMSTSPNLKPITVSTSLPPETPTRPCPACNPG